MTLDLDEAVQNQPVKARQDLLTGAISVAAILMFVGTGSSVLSTTLQHYFQGGAPADRTLVIALLLNVALILFGWRRHPRAFRRRCRSAPPPRSARTCSPAAIRSPASSTAVASPRRARRCSSAPSAAARRWR